MDKWTTWFSMGGYGHFIWPAYGIAFVVMLALILCVIASHKNARKLLSLIESADEA